MASAVRGRNGRRSIRPEAEGPQSERASAKRASARCGAWPPSLIVAGTEVDHADPIACRRAPARPRRAGARRSLAAGLSVLISARYDAASAARPAPPGCRRRASRVLSYALLHFDRRSIPVTISYDESGRIFIGTNVEARPDVDILPLEYAVRRDRQGTLRVDNPAFERSVRIVPSATTRRCGSSVREERRSCVGPEASPRRSPDLRYGGPGARWRRSGAAHPPSMEVKDGRYCEGQPEKQQVESRIISEQARFIQHSEPCREEHHQGRGPQCESPTPDLLPAAQLTVPHGFSITLRASAFHPQRAFSAASPGGAGNGRVRR